MGFTSSDCEDCGHPLLSPDATSPHNLWMNEAIAIAADGTITEGRYNGYGGINEHADIYIEITTERGTYEDVAPNVIRGATVWHLACWEVAGKPREHRGESKDSADQGWFFDPDDHKMRDPRGGLST